MTIINASRPVRPTLMHECPVRTVDLTERERRSAHRLLHRLRTGKRDSADALLGWIGLRLGTKR